MPWLPREIIGLYLEKERLQYVCIKKGMFGLSPKSPGLDMEAYGTINGGEYSSLKKFLKRISPKAKLDIFLTLPRGSFFVRDMKLPPMLLEEAWISVQNNLAVYCHLPLEEIYYDVHLSLSENGGVNALIFYAPRKEIDRFLDIFNETGRRHLLKRVFPLSFGVYLWLRVQGYALPLTLILPPQEGINELAVYGERGFVYSASWPQSEGLDAGQLVLEGARAKMEGKVGRLYFLNCERKPDLPPPENNKLTRLPLLTDNPGAAAIAGAFSRKQQISLDGTPARIKQFRPWHVFLPLCVILVFFLFFLTWRSYREVSAKSEQIRLVKTELQTLENKIKSLESDLEVLEKSRQFFKDIDNYVARKPNLYKVINEIARLMPSGTWFSYVIYEKGKVTLRGTSKDALQVLKLLRRSDLFKQVKLIGSVSRDRFEKERFRLSIELKTDEGVQSNPAVERKIR